VLNMRDCFYCGKPLAGMSHLARKCRDCKVQVRRKQGRCNMLVRRAVLRGELPNVRTMKCVDCGARGWYWEHRNYDEPLKVDPVCEPCNRKRGLALCPSVSADVAKAA